MQRRALFNLLMVSVRYIVEFSLLSSCLAHRNRDSSSDSQSSDPEITDPEVTEEWAGNSFTSKSNEESEENTFTSKSTEKVWESYPIMFALLSCIIVLICCYFIYYKYKLRVRNRNLTLEQSHNSNGNEGKGISEVALREMPLEKYQQASVELEESCKPQDCSVCLVEFQVNVEIQRLQCGHIFHPQCIRVWLANHSNCPLCNQQFDCLGNMMTESNSSVSNDLQSEEKEDRASVPISTRGTV